MVVGSLAIAINLLLLIAALLLAVPVVVFWLECLAALLPQAQRSANAAALRLALLMPAHNEAAGIRPVLEGILSQLPNPQQLVVVADNCTDDTAAIARATGATVLERNDSDRRGKGYALDFGLRFLESNPPDVVVLIDADCEVQPDTIDRIAQQSYCTGRPVQAVYLMEQPRQPKPKDSVSALAFLVKNLVRPRGLSCLGLPCLLTGTGMAFPWSVIRSASLASGNIVEDMQLGIDLAIAGYPPMLCPETRIIGLLPQQEQAAKTQRTRWEHGHLQTLLTQVPRLLQATLQKRRLDLLAMALDMSIPPLSLLIMLWLGVALLALIAAGLGGSWLPATLLAIEGAMILVAVFLSWAKFGQKEIPAQSLLAIPLYLLWKIPLYLAFLVRPQTQWVRTARDKTDGAGS